MPRRRGKSGELLNRIDIAAVPDLAEVWRATNEKFDTDQELTVTVPEGLVHLAEHLARTTGMTTSKFLSVALFEDLADAYRRVWEYLNKHPERWRNISEPNEAALREAALKKDAEWVSAFEDDEIPFE